MFLRPEARGGPGGSVDRVSDVLNSLTRIKSESTTPDVFELGKRVVSIERIRVEDLRGNGSTLGFASG